MSFELTVLGSGSALPRLDRKPSSQHLKVQDRQFLIDCGEGTQLELKRYGIRFQRIHHIFISHLHGDHYLGLMGMLSTFHLLGREKELWIHGPPELEDLLRHNLERTGSRLRFPLRFQYTDPESKKLLFEDQKLEVYSIPLHHGVHCTGFLFREKAKLRKIRKEKLEEYDVPIRMRQALKEGEDVEDRQGKRISYKELTDPPPPSRSFAYCSDTAYSEGLTEMVQNVDLLYHDATFQEDLLQRAGETYHSTAGQAARIAELARAGRLLLGHFSARYRELGPFLEEARERFPFVILARDGLWIRVHEPTDEGTLLNPGSI